MEPLLAIAPDVIYKHELTIQLRHYMSDLM